MAVQKVSLLIAFTTAPTNRVAASPHSGGWSESHWANENALIANYAADLAAARAQFLPTESAVIGYRVQTYTINGNKLSPLNTSSGRFQYPGLLGTLNLPSDGLGFSGASTGNPNTARFTARGIPDGQISFGEYQPDETMGIAVDAYRALLVSALWGFIGRVRTGQSARVQSIEGGIVNLSQNIGGSENVSFLRLLRVSNGRHDPIKGSFLIKVIADKAYTVQGLGAASLTEPSGEARIETLQFMPYTTVNVGRAQSRRVGGPFDRYRGRASARN